MPITINGSGTVTGISAGGLPDGIVTTAEVADANITASKLDGVQTGTAPIYGCRAWVNFDGSGTISTNQTIRASGNVSTVFKNGTGDYTVTFTTAMPDANYAAIMTTGAQSLPSPTAIFQSATTTTLRLTLQGVSGGGSAAGNSVYVAVAIFR